MKLPRITTRNLMSAVAWLAFVLGLGLMAARWDRFRRAADRHEQAARVLETILGGMRMAGGRIDPEARSALLHRARLDELRRAERCRRAMWRPWLSAEPDGDRHG